MPAKTRTPIWAPETDPLWGLRHLESHREKTTGTSWALTIWLCCSWNKLLVSSGQRRTGPPTEPGFSQGFFLHSVTDGLCSLPLSPMVSLVGNTSFPAISPTWLHKYYLTWTELDDAITEFNNEMPSTENWVFNLVILHYWHYFPIVQLLWHNLSC